MCIFYTKIEKHEKLHNIVVISNEWSVENKLLTPTMKIKRNSIEKIYTNDYVEWYNDNANPVWIESKKV